MSADKQEYDDGCVRQLFGVSLDCILAPIAGDCCTGSDLSNTELFREIDHARSRDDPSLPSGVWAHELKKADWKTVIRLTVDALIGKSKDIRLAIRLFEAGINEYGFVAVAPCILIISKLCERYWDEMFPVADGGDIDQRVNQFIWMNDKLSIALRLLPITAEREGGRAYALNDRDMAERLEVTKSVKNDKNFNDTSVSTIEFSEAVAATPVIFYESLLSMVAGASRALDDLSLLLDRLCGDEAPVFDAMSRFLETIRTIAGNELVKRGRIPVGNDEESIPESNDAKDPEHDDTTDLSGREQAYAMLKEAAAYLMLADPHSPAPYLVKKAVEWGSMNTAELYNELFVVCDGKLDIFEMLGIERKKG